MAPQGVLLGRAGRASAGCNRRPGCRLTPIEGVLAANSRNRAIFRRKVIPSWEHLTLKVPIVRPIFAAIAARLWVGRLVAAPYNKFLASASKTADASVAYFCVANVINSSASSLCYPLTTSPAPKPTEALHQHSRRITKCDKSPSPPQRSQHWLSQVAPMRIRITARERTEISAGIINSAIHLGIGLLANLRIAPGPSPPGLRPPPTTLPEGRSGRSNVLSAWRSSQRVSGSRKG